MQQTTSALPKLIFLILSIVGAVWPLAQFTPWLLEHGLDLPLLWQGITATPLSRFAWADVVITVLTIWALMAVERSRQPVPLLWLPVLASMLVGASLSLPLYLYLRECGKPTNPV